MTDEEIIKEIEIALEFAGCFSVEIEEKDDDDDNDAIAYKIDLMLDDREDWMQDDIKDALTKVFDTDIWLDRADAFPDGTSWYRLEFTLNK